MRKDVRIASNIAWGFGLTDDEKPHGKAKAIASKRRPWAVRQPWRERMPRENFESMLHALQLFPQYVQTYSMKQHLDVSLGRRGLSQLTYATFIECLFRIGFVHLCGYA